MMSGESIGRRSPAAPFLQCHAMVCGWNRLSLVQRFIALVGLVLLAGSLTIGTWIARKIEQGVTQNTAVTTALYMDSFVTPIAQELATADRLSESAIAALDRIFADTPLGERVVSFKIWKQGGVIAHAADPSIIGRRFGVTDNLRRALAGEVAADFDDLDDAEDAAERARGLPLLEIYSPIREAYTGEVIAVAEFYESAERLQVDLAAAQREGWLVVGLVMGSTGLLLFGVVAGGGRTIASQRQTLERRVADLADLAEQNRALRLRAEGAAGRAAEMNERYLRRLSAELHDGSTQMLALAALRLDGVEHEADPENRRAIVSVVREAVDGAIREIRHLCRGLAAPELENLSGAAVIDLAIDGHVRRTSSAVDGRVELPELSLPQSHRICVYRFVQEALSNAFRHAGGAGQRVVAHLTDGRLVVAVSDHGPGIPADAFTGSGLGLAGLKERVESLGGAFSIANRPDGGTELTMKLAI